MRSNEKFESSFREPNFVDRAINRFFGLLVGLGIGLSHNYLLQVRGRKTGRQYSTPVNLLEFRGKRFLVAPRGRTQWVRNVEAANEVILKRGRTKATFRLRPIPDPEKPEILKAYLDRFKLTVQRYFPMPAGSGSEAFVELAAHYPVFELLDTSSKQ
jgi:deazaflavin-dependent oxidoreductase (nitroreductase family)